MTRPLSELKEVSMKYIVKRAHQGDKWYAEGDERVAREGDVGHLVARGVLEPVGGKAKKKAVSAPKNKAVTAPQNKAASE